MRLIHKMTTCCFPLKLKLPTFFKKKKPVNKKDTEQAPLVPSKKTFTESLKSWWKLTLPSAKETFDTDLSKEPFYIVSLETEEITFFCESNSGTTPNTKYSRCELRELRNGKLASWTTAQPNTLEFSFKITSIPKLKPRIVIGQIHDSKDDLIELLADFQTGVYEVVHDSYHYGNLVEGIKQDVWYTVQISTNSEGIVVKCGKNIVKTTLEKSVSGCYFKLGNYLQSKEPNDSATVVVKDISIIYSK